MTTRDGAKSPMLEPAGKRAAAKEEEMKIRTLPMLNISLARKMYDVYDHELLHSEYSGLL